MSIKWPGFMISKCCVIIYSPNYKINALHWRITSWPHSFNAFQLFVLCFPNRCNISEFTTWLKDFLIYPVYYLVQDFIDVGYGYDESDPFLDNSEAVSKNTFWDFSVELIGVTCLRLWNFKVLNCFKAWLLKSL